MAKRVTFCRERTLVQIPALPHARLVAMDRHQTSLPQFPWLSGNCDNNSTHYVGSLCGLKELVHCLDFSALSTGVNYGYHFLGGGTLVLSQPRYSECGS